MITVLDVGDGACSVLRAGSGRGAPIAVVDCGSNSMTADYACDRLFAELDGRPELIRTIVVTHFDTDHYAGFLRLASRMRAECRQFPRLTLVSPRPPETSRDFTAMYLALASTVTGIRNLDLAEALREVTAPGQFDYIPVSRDGWHRVFTAGSQDYMVHWPPSVLPQGVATQVGRAVAKFKAVADELRERGNSVLDDNLEIARRGVWLRADEDGERPEETRHTDEPPRLSHVDVDGILDAEFDTDGGLDGPHGSDALDVSGLDLPPDLEGQFRDAWDAFRRANNNMSIVFDDAEQARLVVFGDAESPVLRWLMQNDEFGSWYWFMLAPHHGTHRLPRNFNVEAWFCVSQNGAKRSYLWSEHTRTHANLRRCISTDSWGSVRFAYLPWWRF